MSLPPFLNTISLSQMIAERGFPVDTWLSDVKIFLGDELQRPDKPPIFP